MWLVLVRVTRNEENGVAAKLQPIQLLSALFLLVSLIARPILFSRIVKYEFGIIYKNRFIFFTEE